MTTTSKVWTYINADTALGALAALGQMSALDISGGRCRRDPQVAGVWEVLGCKDRNHLVRVIVYLAGYPDPWGNTRKLNDFECEDGRPHHRS